MSVRFRAMAMGDAKVLRAQPTQSIGLNAALSAADAADLAENGDAWTAIAGDGRILCCGGFRRIWPSHAIAWAVLAEDLGPAHLAITRYARARIAVSPVRRIEAMVRADVAAERRWAELIGLGNPALLRCWGPEARDHILYERIRA